ncbi:site-specific tyrosine recombinase XerS [compost metagenome]
MRISDILPLRVGDVTGTHIVVNEKKTGKRKEIKIRKTLRKELDAYIRNKRDNEYLFPSRNRNKKLGIDPICYSTAYKMIKSVSEKFGMNDVATHSMRKTFGYFFYSETKDIAHLMYLFNHSEEKITLRYVGILQDTLDEVLDEFEL